MFRRHFFFLALVTRKDPRVRALAEQAHLAAPPMVTTAWVIVELADALCDAANRPVFDRLYAALTSMAGVEVIAAEQALLDEGIKRFRSRSDKDWSLTDCISFVAMEQRGLSEALTGDHHFEQAGFVALLK